MLVSNDPNGPVQEPSAGPWGYVPAEGPPQGGAPGRPPAPGPSVPHQADPNAARAWPEQFADPGSPAPGGWHGQSPVSGQPAHYGPPQPAQYGPPQQGWTPYEPVSAQPGQSWPQAGGLDDVGPSWRPRIEPSPPIRNRFLPGLLVGLLVGLVVLAPAGYFVGDRLFGGSDSDVTAKGSPSPSGTALAPYDARQAELNRAKFDGDLAAMAEPWLPYLSRCVNSSDPRAPRPPSNEVTRVTCQLGNMAIFFDEFKTAEARDQDLLIRKQQNADTQRLTPGAAAPTRKTGVSGTNGDYVEYAFKHSVAGAQTFAGIWWDRDGAPLVAARIEVQWTAGLDQSWEPLRDVWQRHG